jgi:hypothetical protein
MLARSPRDRSRSPHRTNGTVIGQSSNQDETPSQIDTNSDDGNTNNSKTKKENESQLRMKSLKVKESNIEKKILFFSLVIYSIID